jgi:hypothetical protein
MKKLALLFVALFCVSAFTDDLPRIAVYVTGDVPNNEKEALGTRILTSLVNSGRYIAIERSKSFLAEIEKEHVKQRSGDIDDNQISALGKQFGVKFVCIAAITPAFGDFQVSARIVDVETAVVVYIGDASSPLKSMDDLERVSDQVVKNMFSGKTTPKPSTDRNTATTPDDLKSSVLPTTVVSAKEVRRQDLKATNKAMERQNGLRFGIGNTTNFELITNFKDGSFKSERVYSNVTFGYHTHYVYVEIGKDTSGDCHAFEATHFLGRRFNINFYENVKLYTGLGYGLATEIKIYNIPSNSDGGDDKWVVFSGNIGIGGNVGLEYYLGRKLVFGIDVRPIYYLNIFDKSEEYKWFNDSFFRYTFGISARYRY